MESGVSILVGSRDRDLRPATVRGTGAKVADTRDAITVFIPADTSAKAIANLQDNGQVAVAFSRPLDNVAVQLKGRCTSIRLAEAAERVIPEQYLVAFVETTYAIGLPRGLMKRVNVWPAWAVSFPVEHIYSQTPGPGAGRPWAEGAASRLNR